MYIIGKRKEYYDYLLSKYGIDKYVVLDRRNSFEREIVCKGFSLVWEREHPEVSYIVIEIGFTQYLIEKKYKRNENFNPTLSAYHPSIYAWLLDSIEIVGVFNEDKRIIEEQIKNGTIKNKKQETNSPTNLYSFYPSYRLAKMGNVSFDDLVHRCERHNANDEYVSLNDFSGIIPPDDAYTAIYNYLIHKKEPIIVDNRSDVEKLLSKGFDKKTSFRKM